MNTIKRKYEMHGRTNHKLFKIWYGEKYRCTNPNDIGYKNYGGRGIKISKEFENFRIWLEYVESLPDAYTKDYSIDRIDNDGDYERGNLRWASRITQGCNTRKLYKQNTSGYRGVSRCRGKWRAQIRNSGIKLHLGVFSTKLLAALAYDNYIISHNLEHTKNFKEKKCQCT